MMFNNKFRIGVLKHPGYNGKGGGTSTSSSTPVDFFGKGARAPYAALLSNLLLGGNSFGGYDVTLPGTATGVAGIKGHSNTGNMNGPGGYSPGSYNMNNNNHDHKGTQSTSNTVHVGGMSLQDYISSMPGYQFGLRTGADALSRRQNMTGTTGGSQNLALQQFGQQYAGNYMQQLIGNLSVPSGAGLIANSSTSSSTGPDPLMGAIGTVAGAVIGKYSDRNLKTNIKHINTVNGIKIYSFNYIWSYIKSIGVMAQDLLTMPEYKDAVQWTNVGYVVNYSKLPI